MHWRLCAAMGLSVAHGLPCVACFVAIPGAEAAMIPCPIDLPSRPIVNFCIL